MSTTYDAYQTISAARTAFLQTVAASNDTGTSVAFTDAGLLQISQATSLTSLSTALSVSLTKEQALWLSDQIQRLMIVNVD